MNKFKKTDNIKKFHKSYTIRLLFFSFIDFHFFVLFQLQKHYQWDTSLDALVKVAWHKKVSRRYSNDVNRWKDHNQRPSFISESIWEAWQCYWESPEFQKKSAQGSMNRMSETRNERAGPSRYTSGSLSHREHAKRLVCILINIWILFYFFNYFLIYDTFQF